MMSDILCDSATIVFLLTIQAWKFGGNDRFVTAQFPWLIKDGNDNSFPQIHVHNKNAFFQDLTGKHFTIWLVNFIFYILSTKAAQMSVFFHNNYAIIDLCKMLFYALCYKKNN